jgi:hypothetical protein
LHDNLDHDAFHDRLYHRSAHRSYQPSFGFGVGGRSFGFYRSGYSRGRGFSIHIGH